MAFKYNSQIHKTNNHPKHSFVDAYSQDGDYLGDVKNLEIFGGELFDKLERQGQHVVYDNEICTYTVFEAGQIVAVYQNIYAQHLLCLGHIKIS